MRSSRTTRPSKCVPTHRRFGAGQSASTPSALAYRTYGYSVTYLLYTPVGKYIDVLLHVVTGLRYTTYSTYWTCFLPPAGTGTQVVRTEYVQFVKNFFSVR